MVPLGDLRAHTDWENGRISPAVHFDDDVYRLEQERVFARAWLVVAHEDMVRKPGDYVTNYMGEVPVIVTRDDAGTIHVLVNKCAHRGVEVCVYDRGNTKSFVCSYHGWSYDPAGNLIGVPMEREIYRDELDKSALGLEEAAKVANFHGLLFASFDPQAVPLEEWLGEDVSWWLKTFVLAAPIGGLEALPGWHRNRSPGNWKLVAENFIGDDYHVGSASHVAWMHVRRELRAKGVSIPAVTGPSLHTGKRYEESAGYARGCPFGLGAVTIDGSIYQQDLEEAARLGPDAVAWVQDRQRRFEIALADREIKPYSFQNGLLFPNLGFMGFVSPMVGRHFLLFHPRGPRAHEVWQWTMVEKNAPPAVKALAVQRVYQGQHMGGVIAPDDVENFERLVDAVTPRRNWARPFHYGMQLGHEEDGPRGLPGNLGPNPSEINQRLFYRFWLDLMEREPAIAHSR
jgi:phenylpropionate dioxygenase-like ring-hydroxylating dioxygenase large terminal subunit